MILHDVDLYLFVAEINFKLIYLPRLKCIFEFAYLTALLTLCIIFIVIQVKLRIFFNKSLSSER